MYAPLRLRRGGTQSTCARTPVINDPADGQSATDGDARNATQASDEHRPDADGAHAATGDTGEVTRHDPSSKYTPLESTQTVPP